MLLPWQGRAYDLRPVASSNGTRDLLSLSPLIDLRVDAGRDEERSIHCKGIVYIVSGQDAEKS